MTATDLLRKQLDHARYQLEKALEGLDGSHVDGKPNVSMMSIRETVAHLADTYTATEKITRGESHEWGTYQLPDGTWHDHVAALFALRERAVSAVLAEDEDSAAEHASDYLIAHDYYHVGQLVSLRLAADPGWDSYLIYP